MMTIAGASAVSYAVTPPEPTVLPVEGSDAAFPVTRVFCIGRNYAEHAVEMGHDPDREPPFFFMKHAAAIVSGGVFPYPAQSADVHHEVEMIVGLGKGGGDIAVETALEHVFGYGIGLDMTCRDLQAEAKKLGRPWEVAKSFEASAPCGPLLRAGEIGHPEKGEIVLEVNGARRQQGDLAQMIWKVPEIVAVLSRFFVLQPGDVIMTGTPAGVAAVEKGDLLAARVAGLGELRVEVT